MIIRLLLCRLFNASGTPLITALITVLIATLTMAVTPAAVRAQTPPQAEAQTEEITNSKRDAQQQFEQAMALHAGVGVIQNFEQARQLLTRAAAAGYVPAIHQLGLYARSGIGGPVDLELSLDLLSRAAQTGQPAYQFAYAETLAAMPEAQADFDTVAATYEMAAAQGHGDAALALGVMLQNGDDIPQNLAKAREYFELAAAQLNPKALNNLGTIYARGAGVAQDYERAARYFQQAADLGLAQGMANLSVLYENGFGVPLDEARAKELARQAGQNATHQTNQQIDFLVETRIVAPSDMSNALARARLGDPIAQVQIAAELIGRRDYHTAHDWLLRAAQNGMPIAMANLGVSYSKGLGVPQDYVLAHAWLTIAQAKGQPEVSAMIGALIPQMTRSQIAESHEMALIIWNKIETAAEN